MGQVELEDGPESGWEYVERLAVLGASWEGGSWERRREIMNRLVPVGCGSRDVGVRFRRFEYEESEYEERLNFHKILAKIGHEVARYRLV